MNEKEVYWISYYNSTDKNIGYNLDSGGKNCKKSQSTREKISKHQYELWNNPEIAAKMRAGLCAGVDTMKAKKGSSNATLICKKCGCEFSISKYLSKNRKYCSAKCFREDSHDYAINGSRIAATINSARADERREQIKEFVLNWANLHKDTVMHCPMNDVEGTYSFLLAAVEERFGVRDFRSVAKSVIGKYSKKEFAKYMMSICNEENICCTGLN